MSYVHLPEQRSLGDRSLYRGFLRVFALPLFCDAPERLSRRFAEHSHHVVLRHFPRRMFEKNEMVLVASDHAPLGQSAWRLFAWLFYCRHFWRRGFAPTGLGKS